MQDHEHGYERNCHNRNRDHNLNRLIRNQNHEDEQDHEHEKVNNCKIDHEQD